MCKSTKMSVVGWWWWHGNFTCLNIQFWSVHYQEKSCPFIFTNWSLYEIKEYLFNSFNDTIRLVDWNWLASVLSNFLTGYPVTPRHCSFESYLQLGVKEMRNWKLWISWVCWCDGDIILTLLLQDRIFLTWGVR